MAAFFAIQFPLWLSGVFILVALILGFSVAMSWNAYHAPERIGVARIAASLGKLDRGVDKDKDDDDEVEVIWNVLVKFKDGSEARWRDVTKWVLNAAGTTLEMTMEHGCATVVVENALWIVDEDVTPERMDSKKPV